MNAADVDGLLQRLELRQERAERHRRRSVRPFDEGRHALPDVVVGGRDLKDAARGVRVDVDEPGRQDLTADVDRRGRRARRSTARCGRSCRRGSRRHRDTRGCRSRRRFVHCAGRDRSGAAVPAPGQRRRPPSRLQRTRRARRFSEPRPRATSAVAHAFLSRCSTGAASSFLPCASSARDSPDSAQPFSGCRFRSSQNTDLGLDRPASREQHLADGLTHRLRPVSGLGVDQRILEPHGAFEMEQRLVEILASGGEVTGQHLGRDAQDGVRRIE